MMINLNLILCIILSYLLGSVPIGYLIAKGLKGIDIRKSGSGNIGATNVARVVGKGAGLVTLLLDCLKGYVAVAAIPMLAGNSAILKILCALCVIAGHNWTLFLRFRGGKGVATTAGVFIGLAPMVFLSCFCVWIIIFVVFKYVSLASILAAVSLPLFMCLYKKPVSWQVFGVILAVVGIVRHKSNIYRLLNKKEAKFQWKKKKEK